MAMRRLRCGSSVVIHLKSGNGSTKPAGTPSSSARAVEISFSSELSNSDAAEDVEYETSDGVTAGKFELLGCSEADLLRLRRPK